MMNKNDFAKLFHKIRGTQRGVSTPTLINPQRDWLLGLGVAVLTFVASAAWSAHVYVSHRDMEVGETTEVNTPTVVYRGAMVQSALEYFADKEERYTALIRAGRGAIVTPGSAIIEPLEALETERTADTEESASSTAAVSEPVAVEGIEEIPVEIESN